MRGFIQSTADNRATVELTEVAFWDNYWRDCPLPSVVSQRDSFDRCLASGLKQHLGAVQGRAFEVGCAPGKWLAFMAKEFGLQPAGIEYSQAGMQATERNFALLGLAGGNIMTGDFFAIEPQAQFDVVMSFGFIEHFDRPEEVVKRHLAWLKPGGKLVLGVPNFNGVYKPLQKALKPEILDKHNLSIMNLRWFEQLTHQFPLKPAHIGYLGSFEPSLPVADRGVKSAGQLLVKLLLKAGVWLRRLRWLDHVNHPVLSSYILAIYVKNASE